MRDRRPSFLCTLAALALMAPAAGCILYSDDEPPPCRGDDVWYSSLRNPDTNACQSFGGGGGGCIVYDTARDVAEWPDWGSCDTACAGLDEYSCVATPGCRGTYTGSVCPPNADCIVPDQWTFLECAAVAPSGPVQGECWSLDAYQCSRHDDCAAFYSDDYDEPPQPGCEGVEKPETVDQCECLGGVVYGDPGDGSGHCLPGQTELGRVPLGIEGGVCCIAGDGGNAGDSPPPQSRFTQCVPEPDPTECGPDGACPIGSHCECLPPPCAPGEACPDICQLVCIPDPSRCYADEDCGAGYQCTAGGVCVPSPDPGECYGEVACDALPPACPAGTLPGVSGACWSGFCIPEEDCGPRDPGSCFADAVCESLPPACPDGTVPGIEDNCWSGYCIPLWACEDQPVQACGVLGEEACAARADCSPIYDGDNCTCTPDGSCTCTEWRFSRCESLGDDPGVPG